MDWIRTCQECGFVQKTKPPNQTKELTNSYRNAKCRRCKSEALDYGKYRNTKEENEKWADEISDDLGESPDY